MDRLNSKSVASKNISIEEVDWEKAQKIFYIDKETILNQLEREVNRYPYAKEILLLLAGGLLISAALLMSGIHRVIPSSIWQGKGYKKYRLKEALKRLHKQKIVDVVETNDGHIVRITKNGLTRALQYKLDEVQVKRRKTWDKKWRIVIFDIEEEKKKLRDEFRKRLKQLGFYSLQESVYVYAFPCFDEVEFLRQIYQVPVNVTYIVAEKIESQENLEKFFQVGIFA